MKLWMIGLVAAVFTFGASAADHTRLDYFVDQDGHERPIRLPEEWLRRRAQILSGMQEAMGPLPNRGHLPPLDVKVTGSANGDGFEKLTLSFVAEQFDGHEDRVPALLLIPDHPPGLKLPAILALHQTCAPGKRALAGEGGDSDAYGLELVKRGYVVLCPDYPSFGDYPYDFKKGAYVSGTMKGIFNHMRCVDLLESRGEVDRERIGAVGHSLGGHNAMFVAVFDPRIKAIVASCGWTPFADYYQGKIAGWTSDRYMPRLRDTYGLDPRRVPFDFPEVVAALAPRPFFSNSPLHDANFEVEGVKKGIAAAGGVYLLLGAKEALQVRYPDCAHSFPGEVREAAYRFLDQSLKR